MARRCFSRFSVFLFSRLILRLGPEEQPITGCDTLRRGVAYVLEASSEKLAPMLMSMIHIEKYETNDYELH